MSQSLAVKYRPKTIEDVLGQQNAVSYINRMITSKNGKTPAALLLSGDTGVGKTTLSRIIGRYLNCDKGNGCGKCSSCKLMDNNPESHRDFLDVNAADTRGIDDIRELVETSRYSPTFKKRIILLDEAHQLTTQAANLLLKGLEEPPPHTMWIIATSEPHKLIKALVGRCVNLPLSRVDTEDLGSRLKYIAKKEGLKLKTKKANKIAEYSGGLPRNAIATLEKILNIVEDKPKANIDKVIEEVAFSQDDALTNQQAAGILISLYEDNPVAMLRFLATVKDPVGLTSKLTYMNGFVMFALVAMSQTKPLKNPYYATPENTMIWKALLPDLQGDKNKKNRRKTLDRAIKASANINKLRNDIFNTGNTDTMSLFVANLLG